MNSHPARLRRLVALAALSLTLLPATAIAQTPSDDGYEADGPTVQNQIESGDPGGSPASGTDPSASAGSDGDEEAELPFTGLDLGLLAGAGMLLVGVGAGVRLVLRAPPAVR